VNKASDHEFGIKNVNFDGAFSVLHITEFYTIWRKLQRGSTKLRALDTQYLGSTLTMENIPQPRHIRCNSRWAQHYHETGGVG
jgi:hypothetical protein